MVEKDIRGGKRHTIDRYAKANNKYINIYKEDDESSYIQPWDEKKL